MLETETRLVEEVAEVCRDCCAKTWAEALNWAGVLVDSKLRKVENVFFLEDIREVPATLPPPEPLPSIQAPFLDVDKVPVGAGKGKEVQPPAEAKQSEDALTIRDMVSKAKEAESKSKAADFKENPPQAKA